MDSMKESSPAVDQSIPIIEVFPRLPIVLYKFRGEQETNGDIVDSVALALARAFQSGDNDYIRRVYSQYLFNVSFDSNELKQLGDFIISRFCSIAVVELCRDTIEVLVDGRKLYRDLVDLVDVLLYAPRIEYKYAKYDSREEQLTRQLISDKGRSERSDMWEKIRKNLGLDQLTLGSLAKVVQEVPDKTEHIGKTKLSVQTVLYNFIRESITSIQAEIGPTWKHDVNFALAHRVLDYLLQDISSLCYEERGIHALDESDMTLVATLLIVRVNGWIEIRYL